MALLVKNANGIRTLYLYGYISSWDISARGMLFALEGAPSEVHLRIHCAGGDVMEGVAIYNNLRAAQSNLTVYIDGVCASMATYIMLAAHKIVMARNARLMVHRCTGGAYGNADDMASMAKLCADIDTEHAAAYAKRSGKPAAWWAKAMLTDNWMTAEEGKKNGIIDEVADAYLEKLGGAAGEDAGVPTATNPRAAWEQYKIPQALLLPQTMEAGVPVFLSSTDPNNHSTKPSDDMSWKLLAKQLGLPENATEADLAAKGIEVLNKSAHLETTVSALEKRAAEAEQKLAEAEAKATNERAEALVEAAVKAGKITAEQQPDILAYAKTSYDACKAMLEKMAAPKNAPKLANLVDGADKGENTESAHHLPTIQERMRDIRNRQDRR